MAIIPAHHHTNADGAQLPEEQLRLSGTVRLALVINLSSFVRSEDADAFRHLRGSQPYAAALRMLHPAAPAGRDEAAAQLEQDAYTLRIFRSRLRDNHFFPTYRIGWDQGMRERMAGFAKASAWLRWTVRIRLTRGGLAMVLLELPFEDETLIACSERVLELQDNDPSSEQGQWALGMIVLEAFLASINNQIIVPIDEIHTKTIRFGGRSNTPNPVRLDRYIVHILRRIALDSRLLNPAELKREYAPILAAFMEGTLIEFDGHRRLPRYAHNQANELVGRDISSWDEELCLFTGESALIYCPLLGAGVAYVGGPMGLHGRAYERYWDGIVRGIEHAVAFRAEVQQAERRTTNLLGYVPTLTRRVNQGDLTSAEIAEIDHLATSLADIFDSLPELRSMAVSSTAFRADYARRKFEILLHELDVHDTLELVNTNVEQLNFFLSYYSDMRLQWQGKKTNDTSVLISEVVMFMALSSFTADTFQVGDRLGFTTPTEIAIVGAILLAIFLLLGAGWVRRLRYLRIPRQ
ncbi:MAG: hypothetical protein SH847_18770 [Roseiflexaceae bacterium]|nr:hypothetical protein [Roseiflexaceae bacterium]